MLFGFAGTAVSFVSFPLGLLIAYPGWGALELMIRFTKFFAAVPHALVDVPNVSLWVICGYYVMLIVVSLSTIRTHKSAAPSSLVAVRGST